MVEDNLRWKTNFGGRQPSVKDDLWWKVTFVERPPWLEDSLPWKMTFGGTQPLVDEDLWWSTKNKKIMTKKIKRRPLLAHNPLIGIYIKF